LTQDSEDLTGQRLLDDALRLVIEQRVSAHLGRRWRVTQFEDKNDEASHPAAILSDGTYAIFVKLGAGALAWDQLMQEVAGLRLLTQRSGVLTPTVIDLIRVEDNVLVIMEAVREVKRERLHWRQMGRALAQIHSVKGGHYGLDTHCYWGDLYRDNRPLADWPDFFWQRRLEPRLRAAVDSGHLPLAYVIRVETLGKQLPELCGPPVPPSLLHGDAHQNNFISTTAGPVLIDPAVYYGHPEIDLAFVDFFAPVSEELFHGYREVTPIAPGFAERRNLWLIPAWLAMVQVEGPQYLEQLDVALGSYG